MSKDKDKDHNKSKRLAIKMDHAIRTANHEVINPMIPELTIDDILPVMTNVARLRGKYIREAFQLDKLMNADQINDTQVAELKALREAYEEALKVAKALEDAIDRDYLDIKD